MYRARQRESTHRGSGGALGTFELYLCLEIKNFYTGTVLSTARFWPTFINERFVFLH